MTNGEGINPQPIVPEGSALDNQGAEQSARPTSDRWDAAATLIEPRARFRLFGVNQRDIQNAIDTLRDAEQQADQAD